MGGREGEREGTSFTYVGGGWGGWVHLFSCYFSSFLFLCPLSLANHNMNLLRALTLLPFPPSLSLGRFQIQTRVSIIDSLSPPFVIGLDVLRHCQCVISFQDKVRRVGG